MIILYYHRFIISSIIHTITKPIFIKHQQCPNPVAQYFPHIAPYIQTKKVGTISIPIFQMSKQAQTG